MSELFPTKDITCDSPRLAWLKKHDVFVTRHPLTGRWEAVLTEEVWGAGATEEEAILDLCQMAELKHWTLNG